MLPGTRIFIDARSCDQNQSFKKVLILRKGLRMGLQKPQGPQGSLGLWDYGQLTGGKTEEVRRGHNNPNGPIETEGLQLQGGGIRSGEEG